MGVQYINRNKYGGHDANGENIKVTFKGQERQLNSVLTEVAVTYVDELPDVALDKVYGITTDGTYYIGDATNNTFTQIPTEETVVLKSDKGIANGVASLDENGRVPSSQLPTSAMEIVGYVDAANEHTLPSTKTLAPGSQVVITSDGYINQSTAFTLPAGNTLTQLEASQANMLISAGYVFTLYDNGTVLGTVVSFNTTNVETASGNISLPYDNDLSATSVPDTVQVPCKTGDYFMVIDGHWIHMTNTSSVDSVNSKTGAVVITADDLNAVTTDTAQTITGVKTFSQIHSTDFYPKNNTDSYIRFEAETENGKTAIKMYADNEFKVTTENDVSIIGNGITTVQGGEDDAQIQLSKSNSKARINIMADGTEASSYIVVTGTDVDDSSDSVALYASKITANNSPIVTKKTLSLETFHFDSDTGTLTIYV